MIPFSAGGGLSDTLNEMIYFFLKSGWFDPLNEMMRGGFFY